MNTKSGLGTRLRTAGYCCFGIFGILGGAFQLDFIAHQNSCGSNAQNFNDANVPNCEPVHFFAVGWLLLATFVPFFAICSRTRIKLALTGAIIAYIAGIFGLYYIIEILRDSVPFQVSKDPEPIEALGHGFVLLGSSIRNGCALLSRYCKSRKS